MNYRILYTAAINVAAMAVVGTTVPQIALSFSDAEIHAGYYVDRSITGAAVVLANEALVRDVEKIGDAIMRAAGHTEHLTFRILNTPAINAYAGPGGFVYINTGLLNIIESQDELAAIIAHEVAHAIHGHYLLQWNQGADVRGRLNVVSGLTQVGLSMVGAGGGYDITTPMTTILRDQVQYIATQTAIGTIATLGSFAILKEMITGYSRELELAADESAVKYMRQAGFNPRALIMLLKRLEYIEAKMTYIAREHTASKLLNAAPGIIERTRQLERIIANEK